MGRVPEGFLLADADTHYYEPRDAFTRRMDPAHAGRAVRVLGEGGRDRIMIGDEPHRFLAPMYDEVPGPGLLREMMRGRTERGNLTYEPMRPEYQQRDARLEVMEEQGVEAALLLPTLGVCVEHQMRHDVAGTYANLRAFNTWLEEEWGYAWRERIFGVPLLSLVDVDLAVAELDRVLDRGARAVHLRPTPVGGRSIADPHFDPFWARLDEAGVPVAFHISEAGYNEMFSVAWGEDPNPRSHRQSALQWTCFHGDRPIMDTVAACVFGNLFGRFPRLEFISLENGSGWVRYLLRRMDKMKGMARLADWPWGRPEGRPSDIVRRHLHVTPFHEDDIAEVVGEMGADHVLFGSDWPHPEGVPEPADFAEALPLTMSDADVRSIMGDNLRRLLRLPV